MLFRISADSTPLMEVAIRGKIRTCEEGDATLIYGNWVRMAGRTTEEGAAALLYGGFGRWAVDKKYGIKRFFLLICTFLEDSTRIGRFFHVIAAF